MVNMKTSLDIKPLLLVPVLALLALPLIGSFDTWLTLSVAGLAMGMIIFIMASGLTLVFGLMDGHKCDVRHGRLDAIARTVAQRGGSGFCHGAGHGGCFNHWFGV